MRAVIAFLFASSLYAEQSPASVLSLQPAKPWVLDYGEARCTAIREFAGSGHPVTFAIAPSPIGETFELIIVREHGPIYAEELEGSVDFGSGPIKSWLLHYSSTDGKRSIYRFRIGSREMARARTASAVTLHIKGAADVSFALDSMSELLEGMQKCTADLQDFWNLGGEKNGRIAILPQGDLSYDFSPNDYPWQALRRNEQGTAQYLLLINENGAVRGCDVVRPSGVPVLDAMGCAVIQDRSKFKPARDAGGRPVRSAYMTAPIVWRIDF
jgi:TonB family protein